MDIQSLRAGFYGGGNSITALAENGRLRQIAADYGSKWQAIAVT